MSTKIDTIYIDGVLHVSNTQMSYVEETLCPPRPVIRQSTTATGAA